MDTELITKIINTILPLVIMGFFIYFFLVLSSCILGTIKIKKQDKTMEHCMSKVGLVFYGVLSVAYVAFFIYSIVDFVYGLMHGSTFLEALSSFNMLTIFTMVYAMLIQDFVHVGKKIILAGNRGYEYRRIKKLAYPKKHKCTFTYNMKTLSLSLWLVDIPKLKATFTKNIK